MQRADRRDPGGVQWLVTSIVLSVVLTVMLNVGLRAFPRAGDRAARRVEDLMAPRPDDRFGDHRRVRVIVPWRAMVIASLVLTVVVNLVLWMR